MTVDRANWNDGYHWLFNVPIHCRDDYRTLDLPRHSPSSEVEIKDLHYRLHAFHTSVDVTRDLYQLLHWPDRRVVHPTPQRVSGSHVRLHEV